MEDQKQKPDPKDDVDKKYTPPGGPHLAPDVTPKGGDVGVGSPTNPKKPFKGLK